MKKTSIYLLSTLFFINQSSTAYAAILYSNNFTETYSGFKTDFGNCTSERYGLICTGATGVYLTAFPNLKCVSGDFTLTGTSIYSNNIEIFKDNIDLNNLVNLVFKPNSNIILNHTHLGITGYMTWDSGIKAPFGKHTYTLCKNGTEFTGYLDNSLIITKTISNFTGQHVGFNLVYGDTLTNFRVSDSLPNYESSLDVPLMKQTSNPWQSNIYDSANIWSPNNPTINSWGCAMTSAAMVFNYHGIKKLPNGQILDPGTLNSWLISQPDGYVGTGWVNWIALSRLSKKAKSINNINTFDALQYKRTGYNTAQLSSDINDGIPGILEVPGHFIVAKGIVDDTFSINDPFYNRAYLTDGYSNKFTSLGRFVPSFTDLSYIMLVTDPKVSIKVYNELNEEVGNQFLQQAITDPLSSESSNKPVNIYYLPEPSSGTYRVSATTSSNEPTNVSAYLYDIEGEVTVKEIQTFSNSAFTINLDKSIANNSTITKAVTYQSALKDISQAEELKLIKHGLAQSLSAMIKNAEKNETSNVYAASDLLENSINNLEKNRNEAAIIAPAAFKILHYDLTTLRDQLNI